MAEKVEIATAVLNMNGCVGRDNTGQVRSDAFLLHRTYILNRKTCLKALSSLLILKQCVVLQRDFDLCTRMTRKMAGVVPIQVHDQHYGSGYSYTS